MRLIAIAVLVTMAGCGGGDSSGDDDVVDPDAAASDELPDCADLMNDWVDRCELDTDATDWWVTCEDWKDYGLPDCRDALATLLECFSTRCDCDGSAIDDFADACPEP